MPGYNLQTYIEELISELTTSGVERGSSPFASDTECVLRLNRAIDDIDRLFKTSKASQETDYYDDAQNITANQANYLLPPHRSGQNISAVGLRDPDTNAISWLKRLDPLDIDSIFPYQASVDSNNGRLPAYWFLRRNYPKQFTIRPTPQTAVTQGLVFRFDRLQEQLWRLHRGSINGNVASFYQDTTHCVIRSSTPTSRATTPILAPVDETLRAGSMATPTVGVSSTTSQLWTLTKQAGGTWTSVQSETGVISLGIAEDVPTTINNVTFTISSALSSPYAFVAGDVFTFYVTKAPIITNIFLNDEIGAVESTDFDASSRHSAYDTVRYWAGINSVYPLYTEDVVSVELDRPWIQPTRTAVDFISAQVPDFELYVPNGFGMAPVWRALWDFWKTRSPNRADRMDAYFKGAMGMHRPQAPERPNYSLGMANKVGGFRT